MGKMNMKLMQGIGETEGLLQKEKQAETNETPAAKKEQKDMGSEGEKNAPSDSIKKTSENTKKTESPKSKTKTKKKAEKGQKQVFSFRAFTEDISNWRAFATATDVSMENLGTTAMNEFINRHKFKLSGTELAIFEAIQRKNVES